jgi:hypothetical protein
MLSVYQQRLIVKLLLDQILKTRETKGIYKNTSAFYRSVNYLIDSSLVSKSRKDNGATSMYRLTLKGEILGRILITLDDMPEDLKEFARTLRSTKEINFDI